MAESFPTAPGNSGGSFPQGHEPRADAPAQASGLLLFRRYQVVRELGRGGMGVVMLAHDTALDIPVAVKLVPDLVVKDTEAIADLRKEVLRGMALNHDGVVRTHHFEKDEDGAAIVMEFVEGDTLTDLKARQPGGCFDPEQILGWLEQLCAVLDYAHREAHLIHRDLKPRNIMLTKTGKVKVADFGIAAVISDSVSRHSMEGKVSGTLSYMSPQQAEGKRPSPLDDIHALGATIYELLTGKPPFFRGNPAAIYQQIINVVPPSMTERREDLDVRGKAPIPPQWEATVAACLAKDPGERPANVREIMERLAKAPAKAEVPTEPAPAPKVRAKSGRGLAIFAVILLCAASGVGVWWWQAQPQSTAPAAPRSTPSSVATPQPSPSLRLVAEARALRANGAPLMASDRLRAALALEPTNAEALTELSALGAELAPASPTPTPSTPALSAVTPMPAPATPLPASPGVPAATTALISKVTASSTLESQVDNDGRTNYYSAKNALDGKTSTAWVAARGAREPSLRISFREPVRIERFGLLPGYGKNADTFSKNNRVKRFELRFPDGTRARFDCADRRETQIFSLPKSITATELTFSVLEVFSGREFPDTAVSEITF